MSIAHLSDSELLAAIKASEETPSKPKEKSLRERIALTPEELMKTQKLIFGEIKHHKKPASNASLRERLEIKPEDIDLTTRNIATAFMPFSAKGVKHLAKVPGKIASTARSIKENSLISRLKRNPTLKKKVLEKLSSEAGAQKFSGVPNEEAGRLAIKSAENYKGKSEKSFSNIFGQAKAHLEPHIAGQKNPNRLIDPDKAIDFGKKQLDALESPTLRREWLASAPGQQYEQLVKLKSSMGGVPVGDAEHIRRAIGNKTSKVGATGNLEQGELRHISGLLKGEIGNKYKEAGNQAHRHWERANKHYTLHKEKNVPKVNETLKHQHDPEAAFAHSTKGINAGASNLRHTGQYLSPKDRKAYFKGVVFDLGKKADSWDATTFYKKFGELPAKNKSLVLNNVGKKEALRLKALEQQLKTMDSLGGKKSGLDIAGEFAPHGIKKWMHPIQAARHNNYLEPKQVKKVVEAIKKKSSSPSVSKKSSHSFDTRMIPGLMAGYQHKENEYSHISDEDLLKMLKEENRQYYARGNGQVKPKVHKAQRQNNNQPPIQNNNQMPRQKVRYQYTDDPYDSDTNDPDRTNNPPHNVLSKKFNDHHIIEDRGQPENEIIAEAERIRDSRPGVNTNTIMLLTKKWKNRFRENLLTPEMQNKLDVRDPNKPNIVEATLPLKMRAIVTNQQTGKVGITPRGIIKPPVAAHRHGNMMQVHHFAPQG